MTNMSYCRFQNTAKDLSDCWNNWDDELEGQELKARERIVELAREIIDYEEEVKND